MKRKNVYYYHVTPDRSDYLDHFSPDNAPRILTSAYRIKKFRHITKHLHLAKEVMLDSGMISAWAKQEVDWADNQAYVVQVAHEIRADWCVMLDLPMESNLLAKNSYPPIQALRKTWRNAIDFINSSLPEGVGKMFVIQGYTLEDYQRCIRVYRDFGIFDMPDIRIGIGSVCRRSLKNSLYEICWYIRQEVKDHHIHAFGIGKRDAIHHLMGIGIDSFDSSSASISVAFNRGFNAVSGRRTNAMVCKQFADEMRDYEAHLNER